MIQPTKINPITDFKRDSKTFVERLKATGQPEVLTIDGRGELVVQHAVAYEQLLRVVELAREVLRQHDQRPGLATGGASIAAERAVEPSEFGTASARFREASELMSLGLRLDQARIANEDPALSPEEIRARMEALAAAQESGPGLRVAPDRLEQLRLDEQS